MNVKSELGVKAFVHRRTCCVQRRASSYKGFRDPGTALVAGWLGADRRNSAESDNGLKMLGRTYNRHASPSQQHIHMKNFIKRMTVEKRVEVQLVP